MFKQLNSADYLAVQLEADVVKARSEQAENKAVANITFVKLAENGEIDEVTATEHLDVFTEWAENVAYSVGALRKYNGNLYKCISAHTAQADWTPDAAVSLWVKAGNPAEEYPEWSQPIGAADTYSAGDKVSYNGKHWQSTCDANVWQPGIYGWTEVEENA